VAVQEIWFGGIILMIIGMVGFFYPIGDKGFTAPQIHEFCTTDWVQFALMFDQEGDLRQLCNTFSIMTTAIYGFVIVGIILIIVGAVKKPKKSIYFCGHCKFAASTEAELYNHSVKEHNDELRSAGEVKREDESTFKYKDEEIQPETHSEKVLPTKPKRDLKKSPTLKGIIIGIIAVSIIYGVSWGLSYHAFVMTNDAMAPTINKGDLIHYDNTPFHEIQVNDIIFYSDLIEPKTWVHKVISVASSKVPRTLTVISEENIAPHHVVTEEQYIGKFDSVIGGGGFITKMFDPIIFVFVLLAAFAIPITVMKIRE